ncbi:MAG: hypothetical protein CHACPFDD_03255 [Phycisphaerae bacterium]|nr:hypothetical protein [Phycisphaerae bacterium]
MTTQTKTRFRTGDVCIQAGRYHFDRYVDDRTTPTPAPSELVIELAPGDRFPQITTIGKECWWLPPDVPIGDDLDELRGDA